MTCPIVSEMPAVSAQYLELEEGNCIIGALTTTDKLRLSCDHDRSATRAVNIIHTSHLPALAEWSTLIGRDCRDRALIGRELYRTEIFSWCCYASSLMP